MSTRISWSTSDSEWWTWGSINVVCWCFICCSLEHAETHWWLFNNGAWFFISVSTKQKLNTKSSTESELVGVNVMMPIIFGHTISCWSKDMELLRTCCYKTTRVWSCWSEMVGHWVVSTRGSLTYVFFLFQIKSTWKRMPLSGAPPRRWLLTSWQSHYRDITSGN